MKFPAWGQSVWKLTAFLLLSSASSWATCHVVRAGASGTGSGVDWTNAYPDLPASLTRGDIYYVAAGTYGAHTFDDADSGTLTIELRSATVADHCTTTGWSDGFVGQAVFRVATMNAVTYLQTIFLIKKDYYIFNGVYRGADWQSGYGIKLDATNLKTCQAEITGGSSSPTFVHDIMMEYLDMAGPHPSTDACNPNGVYFGGGSYNLTVQYSDIHDGGNQFFFQGNTGHPGGDPNVSGYGSGDNILLQYNWVDTNFSSPSNHGTACACSNGTTNLVIRYNVFVDIVGTAWIETPSSLNYNTGNSGNGPWYIYGNLFYARTTTAHCNNGNGVLYLYAANFTGDVYFVNNTIANINTDVCASGEDAGIQFTQAHTQQFRNVYVKNNLWWNSQNTSMGASTGTGNGACTGTVTCTSIVWDHNAYFQHVDRSGSKDPDINKQVSAVNPFVSSRTYDFRLASATNAGTPVSVGGQTFNIDRDGITRGADGVWNRGAFQFVSSPNLASKPDPPANLHGVMH